MGTTLTTPSVSELDSVIDAVASWQRDGLPVQLHPGDLGWHRRVGAATLADALRVWSRDDEVVAVAFLDEERLARMGIAPQAALDTDLAARVVDDLEDPARGALPAGDATVEARYGEALRSLLAERGWTADEPWTQLRRDLTRPVEESPLRVAVVGPDLVEERVAVQRAAFEHGQGMTAAKWHSMADAPLHRDARCLIGFDEADVAVAITTVWSAGDARPGLIEPLGVHRDHRGHGHGLAMTLAAAATLQHLGSSSVIVATPSANAAAVAAYSAAGFSADEESTDYRRPVIRR